MNPLIIIFMMIVIVSSAENDANPSTVWARVSQHQIITGI